MRANVENVQQHPEEKRDISREKHMGRNKEEEEEEEDIGNFVARRAQRRKERLRRRSEEKLGKAPKQTVR